MRETDVQTVLHHPFSSNLIRQRALHVVTEIQRTLDMIEALEQIDFHKGRAPESAMRKLRRLYLRANLDSADVRLLRGVLADTQRMARLATQGGER